MKILFISHDTYRAGAQVLLIKFLQWLRKKAPEVTFEILIFRDNGDLYEEFAQLAPTHIWIKQREGNNNILKKKIQQYKRRQQINLFRKKSFQVIYANTILNGEILQDLADLRIPIITHIHELAFWINQAGDLNLRQVESASNHIICASNAVKNYLQSRQMFENTPIETIYEHVNVNELCVTSDRKSLKEKLGLPANAFLVGASGAELWRKGKDWFIPIALQTFNLAPDKPIHFIWIGGALTYELEYDLIKSGLTDSVHFIPHLPQANKYFHEFDVFLMLSREDPFPIVSLEAAALGVPIICFQNAGGTQEWLTQGGGIIVPYADLFSFAKQIAILASDDLLRKNLGLFAAEYVRNHFDIEIIGQQLLETITRQVRR